MLGIELTVNNTDIIFQGFYIMKLDGRVFPKELTKEKRPCNFWPSWRSLDWLRETSALRY